MFKVEIVISFWISYLFYVLDLAYHVPLPRLVAVSKATDIMIALLRSRSVSDKSVNYYIFLGPDNKITKLTNRNKKLSLRPGRNTDVLFLETFVQ